MKFPLQTISATVPGWLTLRADGRIECVASRPGGPIALGPALTCDHELTAGCSCELHLPGDPELRLDLTGRGPGVRPSAAIHVRGEGHFVSAEERTVFGRRRLTGVVVSPLCDRCLDGRRSPRFAAGLVASTEWPAVLQPLCVEHSGGREVISVDELDDRAGIDVVLGSPSHALVRALLVDHQARFPEPSFPMDKRYVTDLAMGESGRIFVEHIRVDSAGQLWVATWTRVLNGVPGVDVPVNRLANGELEIALGGIRLKQPIRALTDREVERGFTIEVSRTSGHPIPPAGRDAFDLSATDGA